MKDCLGRELKIGDAVAFAYRRGRRLQTGRVSRFTKVQVCIEWVDEYRQTDHAFAPGEDTILIDPEDYALYCLQHD